MAADQPRQDGSAKDVRQPGVAHPRRIDWQGNPAGRSRRTEIRPSSSNRPLAAAGITGHDRGHAHEHDSSVELTIANSSPHTVAVYRRGRFGFRKVLTIAPGKDVAVATAPGEEWRIQDTVTRRLVKTIIVPDNGTRTAASRWARKPPPPAAPRKVKINFHNDMDDIVFVYRRKGGGWRYAKRIYPDREHALEFEIGQEISIRDPRSGARIGESQGTREERDLPHRTARRPRARQCRSGPTKDTSAAIAARADPARNRHRLRNHPS